MYLPKDASRARVREAEAARKNRVEIVRALSTGDVSRRELFKWGILTSAGVLANINGLSPFASSAYAQGLPTGIPNSPVFGALPFTTRMPRLKLQTPINLTPRKEGKETVLDFQGGGELPARRLSYHTEFTEFRRLYQSAESAGPGRRPAARRVFRASEVGRVPAEEGLRDVPRPGGGRLPVP